MDLFHIIKDFDKMADDDNNDIQSAHNRVMDFINEIHDHVARVADEVVQRQEQRRMALQEQQNLRNELTFIPPDFALNFRNRYVPNDNGTIMDRGDYLYGIQAGGENNIEPPPDIFTTFNLDDSQIDMALQKLQELKQQKIQNWYEFANEDPKGYAKAKRDYKTGKDNGLDDDTIEGVDKKLEADEKKKKLYNAGEKALSGDLIGGALDGVEAVVPGAKPFVAVAKKAQKMAGKMVSRGPRPSGALHSLERMERSNEMLAQKAVQGDLIGASKGMANMWMDGYRSLFTSVPGYKKFEPLVNFVIFFMIALFSLVGNALIQNTIGLTLWIFTWGFLGDIISIFVGVYTAVLCLQMTGAWLLFFKNISSTSIGFRKFLYGNLIGGIGTILIMLATMQTLMLMYATLGGVIMGRSFFGVMDHACQLIIIAISFLTWTTFCNDFLEFVIDLFHKESMMSGGSGGALGELMNVNIPGFALVFVLFFPIFAGIGYQGFNVFATAVYYSMSSSTWQILGIFSVWGLFVTSSAVWIAQILSYFLYMIFIVFVVAVSYIRKDDLAIILQNFVGRLLQREARSGQTGSKSIGSDGEVFYHAKSFIYLYGLSFMNIPLTIGITISIGLLYQLTIGSWVFLL